MRKNVTLLGGKPLIAWTVMAARSANIFDRIVVSTEDTEVAETAKQCGADVPFMRPTYLAVDPAGVVQVALHALEMLAAEKDIYETICILLPTAPFRTGNDIREAMDLYRSRPEPNLLSVSRLDFAPYKALVVDENGMAKPCFPEWYDRPSRDLPASFRPNGAIHILDVDWFQQTKSYLAQPVIAYEMSPEHSVDINTAFDLHMAEAILANQISVR